MKDLGIENMGQAERIRGKEIRINLNATKQMYKNQVWDTYKTEFKNSDGYLLCTAETARM